VRERIIVKSPVREYRPPGSVGGAPGNRRPYPDHGVSACGERMHSDKPASSNRLACPGRQTEQSGANYRELE